MHKTSGGVVASRAGGAEICKTRTEDSMVGSGKSEVGAMYTIYQIERLMQANHQARLREAAWHRTRRQALHRSRIRNTLRRAIRDGVRYGIEPNEVEREFTMTLHQVTHR